MTNEPTSPELAVKVKALEWQSVAKGRWFAETLIGGYEVAVFEGDGLNTRLKSPFETVSQWFFYEASAKAAAQADFSARILSALDRTLPPIEDMVLVPKKPTPEMLAAWYRYKNGHHWPDEPPPQDTSDYGAYAAMLAAAPQGGRP